MGGWNYKAMEIFSFGTGRFGYEDVYLYRVRLLQPSFLSGG